MIHWLGRNTVHPIGLDIGHSSIKMIQLCQDDQAVRVIAASEIAIDPALNEDPAARRAFIIQSLRQIHSQGGFRNGRVISCLPSDLVRIKSLRLDTTDSGEIEQFMRTEVAIRLGLNPETDELRYISAGSVFQGEQMKNEVIFFGIERAAIADYLEMLEEAHLDPISIDTVPCALFRSFQRSLRRREDKDIVSVLVDLGSHFTTVIFGKGQQIVFVKQIPLAGQHLTCQVSEKLGIQLSEASLLRSKLQEPQNGGLDEETARSVHDAMRGTIDALAREISLCFKYYAVTFRGQTPSEAIFAGGEAYESILMDAMSRHLGVKIRIAEPLRGFDLTRANFNRRRNPQMCEWAVAVGLGLKGWEIPESVSDRCGALQETT
jgi:type IV pilus assembly protein PilM